MRFLDKTGDDRRTDLFGLFAALARDDVAAFPALRAHQAHAVHAFFVQVATLALQAAGETSLPDTGRDWRQLLIGLTPGHPDGAAWEMVVDDWSQPALLQPPGMDPALRRTGKRVDTPDGIDMLVTARNHDLKASRIADAQDDDWFFALVSLQTQEGQMGAGNYGISRMNGGYGSRVGLSLRRHGALAGEVFCRDVATLLDRQDTCDGIGLVWLEAWDGATSLSFAKLHPLYIDTCRRIRLTGSGGLITGAVLANSAVPRIEAKALKGCTGDPWAPVLADHTKSWGIGATGFGYRKLADLLNPAKVDLPPLSLPRDDETGWAMDLMMTGITRGQGKTEGYHERIIPIPPQGTGLFGKPRFTALIEGRRAHALDAARHLRGALQTMFQGGPAERRPDGRWSAKTRRDDAVTNARIVALEAEFDRLVDAEFFDDGLWQALVDTADEDGGQHDRLWRETLVGLATVVFKRAVAAAPHGELRRIRAIVLARVELHGRLRRFLDPLGDDRADPDERTADAEA